MYGILRPSRGSTKKEDKTMTELQNFVNGYGLGISVEKLADKAYRHMELKGHEVCLINDRYLEVDGTEYLFSKSRKNGCWIVKEI